jgi:hypothetical protein
MIHITGRYDMLKNIMTAYRTAPNREEEKAAEIILSKVKVVLSWY